MTQTVKGPDGKVHQFPDEAKPEQIQSALRQYYGMNDKPESFLGNLTNKAAQTMTFGLADEIEALGAGVGGALRSDKTFKQSYDETLARKRRQGEQFGKKHPIASAAAGVAGGLGSSLGAAKTLAGTIGMGAVEGAATGFGSGQGGIENRLESAATGGALGGATAGLVRGVMPLAHRLVAGKPDKAMAKVSEALRRDSADPATVLQKFRADQAAAPKPEVLADLAGENTRGVARAAAGVPSKAKELVESTLIPRQMGDIADPLVRTGQAARVTDDAVSAIAGGNKATALETIETLMEQRKVNADPAYKQAFEFSRPVNVSDVLEEVDERLSIAKGGIKTALGRARTLLVNDDGAPETSLRILHEAKIALDDMIDAAKRDTSMGRVARRELIEVQKKLVNAMDEASSFDGGRSLYAKARDMYSGPTRSKEVVEMGRNILKEDAELTEREIRNLSQNDKEFFKLGVVQAIRDAAEGTANTGDVVRRITGSPKLRKRLGAAIPNANDFSKFVHGLEREAEMSRTLERMRGSRTTPYQEEIKDAGKAATDVALDAVTGGKTGILRSVVRLLKRESPELDEATASRIGEMLLKSDPATIEQTLRQIMAFNRSKGLSQLAGGRFARAEGRTAATHSSDINARARDLLTRYGVQ